MTVETVANMSKLVVANIWMWKWNSSRPELPYLNCSLFISLISTKYILHLSLLFVTRNDALPQLKRHIYKQNELNMS